jgi:predicted dehydrogenase
MRRARLDAGKHVADVVRESQGKLAEFVRAAPEERVMSHRGIKRVRYVVVGAGNIAQVAVLPAFKNAAENSELVGLVSGSAQKRNELAKRYGIEHTGDYDELEQVIDRARADAVYIATPNHLHREHTELAARSGAHVLCEKPMAVTVADCEAMIHATKARRLKLMIAYRLHFEEANLRAVELTQGGVLGQPKAFSSLFAHQVREGDIRWRPEEGGGGLLDLGVYPINAARSLFRDEPIEVMAMVPPVTDERFEGVDETSTAVLRFPRGQMAQLTVSQGAASVSTYRVLGTTGDLRVDNAFEYAGDITHYLTVDGKTKKTNYAKRDQFAPELLYFSSCILQNMEPEPSGEEGLADIRVVRAIMESARTGRAISLAPYIRTARPGLGQAIHRPPIKEPRTIDAPSPSLR